MFVPARCSQVCTRGIDRWGEEEEGGLVSAGHPGHQSQYITGALRAARHHSYWRVSSHKQGLGRAVFAWQLREEFYSVHRRVILSVPIRHRAINLYLLVLKLTAHLKLINSIVLHIGAAVLCLAWSAKGQAGQFKHFLQMVFIKSVGTASPLLTIVRLTMDQIKSNSLNLILQLHHHHHHHHQHHHKCYDHKPTSTVL